MIKRIVRVGQIVLIQRDDLFLARVMQFDVEGEVFQLLKRSLQVTQKILGQRDIKVFQVIKGGQRDTVGSKIEFVEIIMRGRNHVVP